jgi:hypothetical protein
VEGRGRTVGVTIKRGQACMHARSSTHTVHTSHATGAWHYATTIHYEVEAESYRLKTQGWRSAIIMWHCLDVVG